MKKVIRKSAALITSLAVSVVMVSTSHGGIIEGWDQTNVETDAEPGDGYVVAETYYSTINTSVADGASTTNGVIAWKHGDVQPPGLKVVNGDDVDGTNCLMTTGYNPTDLSDKQCSDPLQSSKRFKLKSTANAPLDLSFDVSTGDTTSYRLFQKWTNGTPDTTWSGFTIELGYMLGGVFTPSEDGDGLGFSDTRGNYFDSTTSYQQKEDALAALFADGLAGPIDKYHPDPGYFNIDTRMSFSLTATEDKISSDGVSASYSDVFGEWINAADVPIAIFYDDDGDLGTDNILMANCAESAVYMIRTGSHSGIDDMTGFTCDGQWVTFRSYPGLACGDAPCIPDGVPMAIELADLTAGDVHKSIELAADSSDANPFYMDYVEDAANLGFNMWITLDENFAESSFTVRYTPAPSVTTTPPADDPLPVEENEICDDGIDNDGDGQTDCADPDCAGVAVVDGTCGPEGRTDTCSDFFDNDGDGQVDCTDSGCNKNKSCRD